MVKKRFVVGNGQFAHMHECKETCEKLGDKKEIVVRLGSRIMMGD